MKTLFFQQNRELFQSAKAQLHREYNLQGATHTSNMEHVAQTNILNKHDRQTQAELCCMAMNTILANLDEYDATGYIPPKVQEHTVNMLQNITQADALFGLLEDLALITRSHTLFAHRCNDTEYTFLQAFENSGEWTPNDGTMVSDWYWLRLPALAIMQDKLPSSQESTHLAVTMQACNSTEHKNKSHTQKHDAEALALHHVLMQNSHLR